MVLHNSKWDRRAKARYLKKHGLQATHENENVADALVDTELGSSESPGGPEGAASYNSEAEPTEDVTILPLYPDIEEQDPEERKLIASHFSSQLGRSHPDLKPHMISTNSLAFDEVSADVDRSKLDREVTRKLGKRAKQVELEEDEDFEAFMDSSSGHVPSENRANSSAAAKALNETDTGKQSFIDSLLR